MAKDTLPDWAPRDALFELLLSRQATALMLFMKDYCVYASPAARRELGLSETGSISLTLSAICERSVKPGASPPGAAEPGNAQPTPLTRADGQRISADCWIDDLSSTGKNARSLMFRRIETPDASLADELARLTIMDSAPDPIFVKDLVGRYLFRNPAGCRMLGMTLEEVIGKTDVELYGKEKGLSLREHDLKVIDSNTTDIRIEHFYLDGKDRWFYSVKCPWRDGDDHVIGVVGITREITEAKLAEQSLEQERDRARSYFDMAGVVLIALDPDGRVTDVNEKGVELLGYTREEIIGQNWFDRFLPPNLGERMSASFSEVISGQRPARGYEENCVLTKHGDTPLIAWRAQALKNRSGKVEAVLSSGVDISQQKRVEQSRMRSEQRFREFAAATSDYFWEMDRNLRFSWFSDRFTDVTGVPQAALLGKTREETGVPGVDPEIWEKHLDDLHNRRPFRNFVHSRRMDDGTTVWLSINGRPVYDEHGTFTGYRGTGSDITEYVEAQNALKESEEKYRKIFDAETAAITLFDAETLRITDVNDAALEMFGYTRGEFLQLSVLDTSAEPEATRAAIGKICSGELRHVPRRMRRRKDGSTFPCELTTSVLQVKGRRVVCVVSRDLTEQEQRERALKDSELRFQAFAESTTAEIYITDLDGRYTMANRHLCEYFGLTTEEIIGKTAQDLFPPALAEEARRRDREVLETKKAVMWESTETWPDGTFTYICAKFPILDSAGKVVAIGGLDQDITSLAKTRTALADSETRFQTFADNTSAEMYIKDLDGRYTLVNRNMATFLGMTEDELIGKRAVDLCPPELAEQIATHEAEVLEKKDTVTRESVETWPHGTYTFLVSKFPVFDANGEVVGIGGLEQDVTEFANTRRALEDSEKRLRAFMDNIDAEAHIKDLQGRYTLVNQNMAEFIGLKPEDMIGKRAEDIYPPEIVKISARHDAKIIETQKPLIEERPERWPDGDYLSLVSKFPIFDSDGKLSSIGGLDHDITELANTRHALEQSEKRFRDFAEAAADYFWETDAEDRFTYFSDNFARVRGISPSTLIGRTRHEAIPHDIENDAAWNEYWNAIKAREPFSLQISRQRPDGTVARLLTTGKPVFDEQGKFKGYRGASRDITDAHLMSERLTYQATHDPLTGLVNRPAFEELLNRVVETARRDDVEHVLCYLDLDQFKVINDSCGHIAGDELLRQLCVQLKSKVRKRDTLARLGGDEFAILMEHCNLDQAMRVAESVRSMINEYCFVWQDNNYRVGASIGMVPITSNSDTATAILSAADAACYVAKDQGRNRIHVSRGNDAELEKRYREMEWVARINGALVENRLELFALPIVPINGVGTEGHHYELLLRMYDESGTTIPPGTFLPAAERYNLATTLDRWVVRNALRWLRAHPAHVEDLHICAINLSGHSVADEEFLSFLIAELDDSDVPASKICFEVTESIANVNLAGAAAFIDSIRQRGVLFALDDFGSGLSSFAYLKTLPVEYLKIDGVFVRDMANNALDASMVKSINEIGHVLEKKTIAEFVENTAILEALRELGVDYAQGNAVGPLVPMDNLD